MRRSQRIKAAAQDRIGDECSDRDASNTDNTRPLLPVSTDTSKSVPVRKATKRSTSSKARASKTNDVDVEEIALPKKKRSKKTKAAEDIAVVESSDDTEMNDRPETEAATTKTTNNSSAQMTLPRTIEESIRQDKDLNIRYVLGIDEAGRGPLAGPVVAAAVCFPPDAPLVAGVVDSKKITVESTREDLYHQIVATPGVSFAVAIVDAKTIDDINILQATLLGMKMAAAGVMMGQADHLNCKVETSASVSIDGCYIIVGGNCPLLDTDKVTSNKKSLVGEDDELVVPEFYALIDGNRMPKNMPCRGHAVVKGDGREYSIAAASILAKVTRDRLMHDYDVLYPAYGLAQHKGYPTAMHRQAVRQHGASPIHRRTFAPLKHMQLHPETGKVMDID